jgi:putative transposase
MCKYHKVFTPKYRRKIVYNKYRESIEKILRDLCKWKGVEIIEGSALVEHIHLVVSIPPKYSVSSVMGYLKERSQSFHALPPNDSFV